MISERMHRPRPVLRQSQWVTNLTNGEQVSIFQDSVYFNIIVRHFLHNRIETKNTDIKTVRGTEIEHQDLSYLTTGLRSLHKVPHVHQPLFFPPFKCQLTFPARADHDLYTESHFNKPDVVQRTSEFLQGECQWQKAAITFAITRERDFKWPWITSNLSATRPNNIHPEAHILRDSVLIKPTAWHNLVP